MEQRVGRRRRSLSGGGRVGSEVGGAAVGAHAPHPAAKRHKPAPSRVSWRVAPDTPCAPLPPANIRCKLAACGEKATQIPKMPAGREIRAPIAQRVSPPAATNRFHGGKATLFATSAAIVSKRPWLRTGGVLVQLYRLRGTLFLPICVIPAVVGAPFCLFSWPGSEHCTYWEAKEWIPGPQLPDHSSAN